MQFQSYKIADLIPASYNPRKKLKLGDKEYEKSRTPLRSSVMSSRSSSTQT